MSKPGNAFYYFMMDFQAQPGKKYKSLREVADAAGPHWKNLSKDKKAVYEQRARSAKLAGKASKLNSDKMPVDEIEEMERREIEWKQQMKDDIQATLTFAKRSNILDTHSFL
ncbi:hypothetical protein HHI36_005657 [Cryptolaemus montrouzieri]|uniref:HMG box domain-containing protein n=1 Tax=Cryptolaemus montrouzieri TaxID=559131 RepID=A0ABD2NVF2_9CUCU